MKLYPKKLNSVADLEKEKQVLKYASRQIDTEGIFAFKPSTDKVVSAHDLERKEGIAGIIEKLASSSTLLDIVMKVGMPLLRRKSDRKKRKYYENRDEGPSFVQKAAIEFISGYLKWKAIELAYKGLKKAFDKKKSKI